MLPGTLPRDGTGAGPARWRAPRGGPWGSGCWDPGPRGLSGPFASGI